MGKAIAGFFTFLFAVLVIAVLGYNTYEISRLRGEVAALKAERGIASKATKKVTGDPFALLAEARRHADLAQASLRKKDYGTAQKELALATAAAQKASESAEGKTEGTLATLRGIADNLAKHTENLWEVSDADKAKDKDGKESAASRKKTGDKTE